MITPPQIKGSGMIALAIDGLVVRDWLAAAHGRWDDDLSPAVGEKLTQAVGVVGLVSDEALDRPGVRS